MDKGIRELSEGLLAAVQARHATKPWRKAKHKEKGMCKSIIVIMIAISFMFLPSCATTKRYIEIQDTDYVMIGGRDKFKVQKGDVLEVIQTKPCRGNYYATCWKVRNTETGETGYVMADKMDNRHRVYI